MSQVESAAADEAEALPDGQDLETILLQWRRERPDIDPSVIAICGEVWRAAARLRRSVLANLSRSDIDFAGFDVIMTLRRQGRGRALSPSALAREMMLSTSAMTNRLDRLERRGLIERTPDPDDRRGLKVVLSKKGFALVDGLFASHVTTVEGMLSSLSTAERDSLRSLLAKIDASS